MQELHEAEVIAQIELPDGDWPGLEATAATAEARCVPPIERLPGPEPEPFYFFPTEESWGLGDRTILCVAEFASARRGPVGTP